MQLRAIGNVGVVLEATERVTYEQVETALHEQGFLSGYQLEGHHPGRRQHEIYVGAEYPWRR